MENESPPTILGTHTMHLNIDLITLAGGEREGQRERERERERFFFHQWSKVLSVHSRELCI